MNIVHKEKGEVLQQRHANFRNQAIQVATQCIEANGLSGLNARFVARSIGCSVGTLYNIFKNIDFLVFEVNLNTLTQLHEALTTAIESKNSPEQAIHAIAQTYIQFSMNHQNLWLTLFEHRFSNPANVPQDYKEKRGFLFQLLETQFALLNPSISKQAIAIEARAFWAGVHGICSLYHNDKLSDDGQAIQDIANTLIQKFTASPRSNV